jgi:hypothetical protein
VVDKYLVTSRDNPNQDYIDSVISQINNTPDGILVNPDGLKAFIISNRRTESFVMFEALDGTSFLEMSKEEIRGYMRRKLAEAGLDDIEA